jgi:hypothetical protein
MQAVAHCGTRDIGGGYRREIAMTKETAQNSGPDTQTYSGAFLGRTVLQL